MIKTGLKDKKGNEICIGDTVQWGDPEGTRTAIVVGSKEHIGFKCFKNSNPHNWAVGHTFCYDHFVYQDTSNNLTIMKKAPEITSASPTSTEGMELPLNPIPSQNDNKNNNGSETKPSMRGI